MQIDTVTQNTRIKVVSLNHYINLIEVISEFNGQYICKNISFPQGWVCSYISHYLLKINHYTVNYFKFNGFCGTDTHDVKQQGQFYSMTAGASSVALDTLISELLLYPLK